jgi:hypothetical protein
MPFRSFKWYHLLLAWLVFIAASAVSLRATIDVRNFSSATGSIVAVHVPLWVVTLNLILLAVLIAFTIEFFRARRD